jgi:hypothetical protein
MFVLMFDVDQARTDRELQMLEGMVDCAHTLAMAFGAAAMAEDDFSRKMELAEAFQRSSKAVRLGIGLRLRLRAAPKLARAAAERPEALKPESDRLPRESDHARRERERDHETVSLPKFLSTMRGIAADARRLDTQLPAGALPTLERLLAQVKADAALPPAPAGKPSGDVAVLTGPPPRPAGARRSPPVNSS